MFGNTDTDPKAIMLRTLSVFVNWIITISGSVTYFFLRRNYIKLVLLRNLFTYNTLFFKHFKHSDYVSINFKLV